MVPLSVLSRTNPAESFLHFPHNPQSFSSLPPLEISCLSFFNRRPLFSITSSLLWQNAGGGVSLRRLRVLCASLPRASKGLPRASRGALSFASVFLPFAALEALRYLPLESTLAKVYQNKQLQLPLESTLVKNRGRGAIIVNQFPVLDSASSASLR